MCGKYKRILFPAVVFATVICIVLMMLLLNSGYGYLRVSVLDGFSEKPIENAAVVIPETGKTYFTDEFGKTELITVPIQKDAHYDALHRRNDGIITLLVYSDGYLPYAVFYLQVEKNKTRNGPTILMFEKQEDAEPFVIVESPDFDWAHELIEKYSKKLH